MPTKTAAMPLVMLLVVINTSLWSVAELAGASDAWSLRVETVEGGKIAPVSAWLEAVPPSMIQADDVLFEWRCADQGPAVRSARASHGCWYPQQGSYRPSVTILVGGRPVRTILAAPIVVQPRPPVQPSLELSTSNSHKRAPMTATARLALTLPDDESVRSITWVVNERALEEQGRTVKLEFSEPGEYRISAIVRTTLRTMATERTVTVHANQPPVCRIGQEPASEMSTPLTVKLTAHCRDEDGNVVAWQWAVQDRPLSPQGPSVFWTAPREGRYVVHLTATDDAGGQATVTDVIEWTVPAQAGSASPSR